MNKLEQLFHNAGNASMPNHRKTVAIKSKGNGIWKSTGGKKDGEKYGEKIGNIRVVAPTSANDIALLVSTQSEAQALLDIVSDITSKDLVKINPSKSELVPFKKDTAILVCVWTQKRSNKQQKLNTWE